MRSSVRQTDTFGRYVQRYGTLFYRCRLPVDSTLPYTYLPVAVLFVPRKHITGDVFRHLNIELHRFSRLPVPSSYPSARNTIAQTLSHGDSCINNNIVPMFISCIRVLRYKHNTIIQTIDDDRRCSPSSIASDKHAIIIIFFWISRKSNDIYIIFYLTYVLVIQMVFQKTFHNTQCNNNVSLYYNILNNNV